jgi:hypothetical protein
MSQRNWGRNLARDPRDAPRAKLVEFLDAIEPDVQVIRREMMVLRALLAHFPDLLAKKPPFGIGWPVLTVDEYRRSLIDELSRLQPRAVEALEQARIHGEIKDMRLRNKRISWRQQWLSARLARVREVLEDFVSACPKLLKLAENELPKGLPGLDTGLVNGRMQSD